MGLPGRGLRATRSTSKCRAEPRQRQEITGWPPRDLDARTKKSPSCWRRSSAFWGWRIWGCKGFTHEHVSVNNGDSRPLPQTQGKPPQRLGRFEPNNCFLSSGHTSALHFPGSLEVNCRGMWEECCGQWSDLAHEVSLPGFVLNLSVDAPRALGDSGGRRPKGLGSDSF